MEYPYVWKIDTYHMYVLRTIHVHTDTYQFIITIQACTDTQYV